MVTKHGPKDFHLNAIALIWSLNVICLVRAEKKGGINMSNQEKIIGLSNIARTIANKDADIFAVVIVDGHRTGNMLAQILERSFSISKKRITKLGPTSSEMQNALNLARQRDIVISHWAIVSSSSPFFSLPSDVSEIMIVKIQGDSATIDYHKHEGGSFRLT